MGLLVMMFGKEPVLDSWAVLFLEDGGVWREAEQEESSDIDGLSAVGGLDASGSDEEDVGGQVGDLLSLFITLRL